MTIHNQNVNGGYAALENVARFMTLAETLRTRDPHLPGLGVFHGPSGFGKTYAAIYCMNVLGALRLEIGDSWTKKKFLENLLKEAGIEPGRASIADLTEKAIIALGEEFDRPLIIDEADKLVDKGMIELVREIHEHSQAPVILIGEELLPNKLKKVERVHNRVLEWVPAEPCSFEDARLLADLYCPDLVLSDELVALTLEKSGGRARRIAVNLNKMLDHARREGECDLTGAMFHPTWFYTGEPPKRLSRRAA